MLAVEMRNPLFWALLVAWIMTVVLHEFSHGLVAWLGGDYTIKERGGLTLNPLQYIDPVFSLLLPAIFLLMGGIPLPGGVTYIRHDLLRSRAWSSAVAAAGPAMNLLLLFACAIPFHPTIGWIHPNFFATPDSAQLLLGAMAVLQFLTVLFNLVPVPPLDGFQMLRPYLDENTRRSLSAPPTSTILFIAFFLVLWKVPDLVSDVFNYLFAPFLHHLGFGYRETEFFRRAYNTALFSEPG